MLRKFATRRQMALILSLTLVWAVLSLSHGRVVCIESDGDRAIEPGFFGQCAPIAHCDDSHSRSDNHAPDCIAPDCEDELLAGLSTLHPVKTISCAVLGSMYVGMVPEIADIPGWTALDVRLPGQHGPPLRPTSVLIAQTMVLRI